MDLFVDILLGFLAPMTLDVEFWIKIAIYYIVIFVLFILFKNSSQNNGIVNFVKFMIFSILCLLFTKIVNFTLLINKKYIIFILIGFIILTIIILIIKIILYIKNKKQKGN